MAGKRKVIRRSLTGQALRDLKHAVATLKTKGLVSKRVDARKYPTRYMQSKVKGLAPVLEGRLSPVRRSPKIAKEYKLAGFKVVNNRLLLPPEQAASVRHKRDEYVTLEKMTRGGTIDERVILPASVSNIEEFMSDEDRLNRLLGPDRRFGFTFFGNSSLQTFPNASSLFDYLSHYQAFDSTPELAWKHFVLYRIKSGPNHSLGERAEQWQRQAHERHDRAEEKWRKSRVPRRLLPNGRNDISAPRHRFTAEEIRNRDKLAHAQARKARNPEAAEAYRVRNRERMRKVRGTKKPRK